MRLLDLDHRGPIVEEIRRFAPAGRDGIDVQHGGGDALAVARHRNEAQYMARTGDRGVVGVGRGLAHIVDHAGRSSRASAGSAWPRKLLEIASDRCISAVSVARIRPSSTRTASAVRSLAAVAIEIWRGIDGLPSGRICGSEPRWLSIWSNWK